MHVAETQAKQKAKNSIHHAATKCTWEKISREAIFVNSREGRVQCSTQVDWNPGQNLVPEQKSKDQEVAGVGTGATSFRVRSSYAPTIWYSSVTAPRSFERLQSSSCFLGCCLLAWCRSRLWATLLPMNIRDTLAKKFYKEFELSCASTITGNNIEFIGFRREMILLKSQR